MGQQGLALPPVQRGKALAPAGHYSGFEGIALRLEEAGLSHILPTSLPETLFPKASGEKTKEK